MGHNELVEGYLEKSNNIYDFYIQIYYFLKKSQSDVIRQVNENYDEFEKYSIQLKAIFSDTGFNIILNKEIKSNMLKTLNNHKKLYVYLAAMLVAADDVFGDRSYRSSKDKYDMPNGKRVILDCLNTESTYKLGKVFYKPLPFIYQYNSEEELFRQLTKTEDTVDCFQKYLLVFPNLKGDYRSNIIRITWPYINDLLKETKSVKIALVPLTGDFDYIKLEDKGSRFFLTELRNEEKYKKKILDILESLKTEKITIVVFPEMVFSENILKGVKEFLHKNKGCFTLFISGTIWGNGKNQCAVVSGDGIELFRQLKLNPFHKTANLAAPGNNEGIIVNSDNKIVNIFDIETLGRIATPICVDFLSNEYLNILQNAGVSLSLVPAFTSSLKAFNTNAGRMASANAGVTCVCNCCIPIVNEEDGSKKTKPCNVLFTLTPLKENISGSSIMESCIPNESKCDCNNKKFCIFLITFSEKSCVFSKVII